MNKKIYSISFAMLLITFASLPISSLGLEDIGYEVISVQDAHKLIEENSQNPEFVILDVRTEDEYKAGHISSSANIDYKSSKFKESLSQLDKEKIYVTYCRSGRRSAGASEIMNELGFQKIYMIDGGIIAWQKAGLPIQEEQ